MKIQLGGHRGKSPIRGYAIIDKSDYSKVSSYKWHASSSGGKHGKYYPMTNALINGKYTMLRMHHLIFGKYKGFDIDHINGNSFDNRRSNLRKCLHSQNTVNRGLQRNNKSGYKGVYFNKARGKWQVTIKHSGKSHYGGIFSQIKDAAECFNSLAKKQWGDFAILNKV